MIDGIEMEHRAWHGRFSLHAAPARDQGAYASHEDCFNSSAANCSRSMMESWWNANEQDGFEREEQRFQSQKGNRGLCIEGGFCKLNVGDPNPRNPQPAYPFGTCVEDVYQSVR